MAETKTYYFVLPEVSRPVGGVNVALQVVDCLRSDGVDVRVLHATAGYRYGYFDLQVPVHHDPRLRRVLRPRGNWRARISALLAVPSRSVSRTPPAKVRDVDVLVLPEYHYPELAAQYPNNAYVLAVQDVFGFARAYIRDHRAGTRMLERAEAIFVTSEASAAAVRAVTGSDCERLRLAVGRPGLDFEERKARKIAFMPRKRPEEVAFVVAALQKRPELRGYEFVEIDRMPEPEMVRSLRESLIFLSFSKQEGFGLPPAEAMRAGCLTIGYTGVGGTEYFTSETGIVVSDSDVVGLVEATAAVAEEYDRDPARLDALRRHASNFIRSTYSEARFRETTLQVFRNLDTDQLSS